MKVTFSQAALNDLIEIEIWILQDRPAAAAAVADRLYEACLDLGHLPDRFPAFALLGLRRRVVESWSVFYRVTNEVQIVRVLHSARNPDELLQGP